MNYYTEGKDKTIVEYMHQPARVFRRVPAVTVSGACVTRKYITCKAMYGSACHVQVESYLLSGFSVIK